MTGRIEHARDELGRERPGLLVAKDETGRIVASAAYVSGSTDRWVAHGRIGPDRYYTDLSEAAARALLAEWLDAEARR